MQNLPPPAPIIQIIEVINEPSASIDMIQVAVAAFGLTGMIMGSAAAAGILAGILFILYRRRRPASTIESRGYEHNLFRAR